METKEIHVHDQFINKDFGAEESFLLCNPVEKIRLDEQPTNAREGRQRTARGDEEPKPPKVLHPEAHLVCYEPRPRWFWNKKVRITNQFEPKGAEVTPTFTAYICVPSTKTDAEKEKPEEKPEAKP